MMMTNSNGGNGMRLTRCAGVVSAGFDPGFGQRREASSSNGSSAVRVRCHAAAQINLHKAFFSPAGQPAGDFALCVGDRSSITNNNKGS